MGAEREPWFVALTPWGESFGDLADVALADRSAPPALALAAFKAKALDDPRDLQRLVRDAVALGESEAANSQPVTR